MLYERVKRKILTRRVEPREWCEHARDNLTTRQPKRNTESLTSSSYLTKLNATPAISAKACSSTLRKLSCACASLTRYWGMVCRSTEKSKKNVKGSGEFQHLYVNTEISQSDIGMAGCPSPNRCFPTVEESRAHQQNWGRGGGGATDQEGQ